MTASNDAKLDAPAYHRNVEPILEVLRGMLDTVAGDILEVGSGTGQHATAFARALPNARWWPTDPDVRHRSSIDAWRSAEGTDNLQAPVDLDAARGDWELGVPGRPPAELIALVSLNVTHISPWSVTEGLIAGAGRHLSEAGRLFLYGPYSRDGVHVSDSNIAFDASLKARDPAWGIRDVADIERLAADNRLRLERIVTMPANNFSLVFRR